MILQTRVSGDQERCAQSLAGTAGVSHRGPGQLGTWPPECRGAHAIWPDAHAQLAVGIAFGPWPFVQVGPGPGIPREGHGPARGSAPLCLPASWSRPPIHCPGTLLHGGGQKRLLTLNSHPLLCPSGARCSLLCASSHEVSIKMLEHPFAHSPSDAETHLLPEGTVSV